MPYHPESLTDPSQAKTSASTTTQAPWNPINGLSTEHFEMIKQRVQGIPVSKIVYNFKRYGVKYSSRHITRVLESPLGREFASLFSAQLHNGTAGLVELGGHYAPEALFTEIGVMRNPLAGDRHRLAAAADVMDRVGPPKISRQENENKVPTQIFISLSASQLSQFAAPPAIVEAEVVALIEPTSSANDD